MDKLTIELSPDAMRFMLELLKGVQVGADHPQLVDVARWIVEVRDTLTDALPEQ